MGHMLDLSLAANAASHARGPGYSDAKIMKARSVYGRARGSFRIGSVLVELGFASTYLDGSTVHFPARAYLPKRHFSNLGCGEEKKGGKWKSFFNKPVVP